MKVGYILGVLGMAACWYLSASYQDRAYQHVRAIADYYALGAIHRGYVTSCEKNGVQGVWYKSDCDGMPI